ncbi:MAG TPA: zf-HC2 domain-containing protein [Actinomycetota bacterium]|nr:zf-HC2 domain-containing protein [Actinomycetota bacterium]
MSEISCDDVLVEIEHYLHGELDPIESERLAEHLNTCTPCLDRAEFQRKLKEIVRVKCQRTVTPESVVWKVQAALRAEIERRPDRRA